jgi:acylphosphatase
MEMPKVRILITGKVQGVFFRQSARQQAKSLKIGGWVKNLPDGSVLSEAAGTETSLSEYICWCKKGPPRARVTNTVIEWLNQDQSSTIPVLTDFEITE